MDELKPCRCGGTARLWTSPTGDFIRCDVCGFTISYLGGFDDALLVEEWNRRIKPENNPLTLEQLRKMCKPTITQLQQTEPYAPVWVVTLGDKKISCQITRGLIKTDNRCKPPKEYIDAHMVGLLLSDYGKTWLAYVHKPEGSAP